MNKLEQKIEKIENRLDAIWRHVFNSSDKKESTNHKIVFEYSGKEESKERLKMLCESWNKPKLSTEKIISKELTKEMQSASLEEKVNCLWRNYIDECKEEVSKAMNQNEHKETPLVKKGDIISHSMYKGITVTVIDCTNEIEFQAVIIKEYSGLPQLKLGDIIVVCNSQHFTKI